MKIYNIYYKYLYILQLYEYDLYKFTLFVLRSKIFKKYKFKDRLVYTGKIKTYLIIIITLQIVTLYPIIISSNNVIPIIVFTIFIYFLTPIYIVLSSILLEPISFILKEIIIQKAKRKVSKIKDLKIITITGSYGKTSTTSFVYTLLHGDKKVFMPKSSVNTILGIAREINMKMPQDIEILLLEIGTYKKGDVEEVCEKFPPDISIIVSIGTQHLERFKSIENIISAESENIKFAKSESTVVIPQSVYDIKGIPKINTKTYRIINPKITDFKNFKTYFKKDKKTYHTNLMGEGMISNLAIAIDIAEFFSVSNIEGKLQLIKPVARRLSPYYEKGILFIDDTYNIGIESATIALNVLEFLKSKKVSSRVAIITGGIVERGDETKTVNEEYGKLLNKIDIVFLFDTPYRGYLENGINDKKKIVYVKDYKEFDSIKYTILKKGDTILMQNEITDLYYI